MATKIVYQSSSDGTRYAGITLDQLTEAMFADKDNDPEVSFAADTFDKDDLNDVRGIRLCHIFGGALVIMTARYGGGYFNAVELDSLDAPGVYNKDDAIKYRLKESFSHIIENDYLDDGLIWCEVNGCIEAYLDTLPESELDVINTH